MKTSKASLITIMSEFSFLLESISAKMIRLLIVGLWLLPSFNLFAQDCNLCYECEWVYNLKGQKVLFSSLNKAEGLSGAFGAKESHTKTGTYEENCLKRMKLKSTQIELERRKYEANKQKNKNGETVSEWYEDGSAKSSVQTPVSEHSNISYYNRDGSLSYTYKDNVIYLFKDNKLDRKGPGIIEKDSWGNVNVYMQGVWFGDNNEMLLYDHNENVSSDFMKQIEKSKDDKVLDALYEKYPYIELKSIVDGRKTELLNIKLAQERYTNELNIISDSPTTEKLKSFQVLYPDSLTTLISGLIRIQNNANLSDTIILPVNSQTSVIISKILFKTISDAPSVKHFIEYGSAVITKNNAMIITAKLYDQSGKSAAKMVYNNGILSQVYSKKETKIYYKGEYKYKIKERILYDKGGNQIIEISFDKHAKLMDLYSKIDSSTFNTFITTFINIPHHYESYETVVAFYTTIINIQFINKNYERVEQYADAAMKNMSELQPVVWLFEGYKGLGYWKADHPEKMLNYFQPKINQEFFKKGEKVFNGTGSPTYTEDIKIKYYELLKESYESLHSKGITFSDEKNIWKKIKELRK